MSPQRSCPDCGATLLADAPRGLCPNCLMGAAVSRSPANGRRTYGELTASFARPDRSLRPAFGTLAALAESLGGIPSVLLEDTEGASDLGAVIQPASTEMPEPADRTARLQLLGEIARGGMGAVLKGRDVDLGRDLAVKILLEKHRDRPDLVRRFIEEAQIAGQLQHPGVVPVYELGAFADRRPYFAMKLVKGRTLAALLHEREDPQDDRSRFLGIFEQVCQTVAYAHARGVIHRDLKPSNVMVGNFGEVQVMDWGLAKILPRGGVVDDAGADQAEHQESVIATVRTGSDTDLSQAGSVLGTPAYMSPEQASGELERVDRRADVFGLGSILCEILTGQPAYTARSQPELIRKAMRGDTADAVGRLEGCGADAELVGLAKDCLASEPDDRPRDAGMVAGRVTAYLAGVQQRLRAAELARVEAHARAEEHAKRRVLSEQLATEAQARAAEAERRVVVERQRRRYQIGLATSVLALTLLAALWFDYWARERQARIARSELALKEAFLLRDSAASLPEDVDRWRAAARGIEAAAGVIDQGSEPDSGVRLAALRAEVRAGLNAAARDRTLLEALANVRARKQELGKNAENEYANAFRRAGFDIDNAPPAVIAAAVTARPASVAAEATAALDDWALLRRQGQPAAADFRRLVEAARAADPDPFRDKVRAAIFEIDNKDPEAELRSLAADPKASELPTPSAMLLASALRSLKAHKPAIALLRSIAGHHPDDVSVNYELAAALTELRPPAREEAVRYLTAARALRPEGAHPLAHLLEELGRGDEALAVFADLAVRRPGDVYNLACYGRCLQDQDSPEAARVLDRVVSTFSASIRRMPNSAPARLNLAVALANRGKLDEAISEYRAAIRLVPGLAAAHLNLGGALIEQGKPDDAVAEYRAAIRLTPDMAEAHYGLGLALERQGNLVEAEAEYRAAIRIEPYYAEAHCNLAEVLSRQGDFAGSLNMYRKGHELGSKRVGWRYPSARWVADAERSLALAKRLPAVLRGDDEPGEVAEQRDFARMAYRVGRFAMAVRLWAMALSGDPKLGDDRDSQPRYDAACAAALAACGRGKEDPKPDDVTRDNLRRQALSWLRAELTAWGRFLDGGDSRARARVARTLRHWKGDIELAGVRDPDALARLPEAERSAWGALWAEVEALLKRADNR